MPASAFAARPWTALCIAAASLLAAGGALAAQALPGGAELGMSPQQLRDAVPGAAALRHPVRMGGGLVGSFTGPATPVGEVVFVPTYFFANGVLTRVEYLAQDAAPAAAFDAVEDWCARQWGPALRSGGPEGSYASWSGEEADRVLQETAGTPPRLRLVVKLHADRDASEL